MFTGNQINSFKPSNEAGFRKGILTDKDNKKPDPVTEYWRKVEAKESQAGKTLGRESVSSLKDSRLSELVNNKPAVIKNPEISQAGFSKEQIEELFEDDPWEDLGNKYENGQIKK